MRDSGALEQFLGNGDVARAVEKNSALADTAAAHPNAFTAGQGAGQLAQLLAAGDLAETATAKLPGISRAPTLARNALNSGLAMGTVGAAQKAGEGAKARLQSDVDGMKADYVRIVNGADGKADQSTQATGLRGLLTGREYARRMEQQAESRGLPGGQSTPDEKAEAGTGRKWMPKKADMTLDELMNLHQDIVAMRHHAVNLTKEIRQAHNREFSAITARPTKRSRPERGGKKPHGWEN